MDIPNTDRTSDDDICRNKGEELPELKSLNPGSPTTDKTAFKHTHELQVYQVELETQNQELLSALSATQVAVELFDFAPIGYFTISGKGEILTLNLSGATMLGQNRLHLKNSQFGFFVSDDTKPIFNLFLSEVFARKGKETCDVTLLADGNSPTYVHLVGNVSKNEEYCLLIAVDITERKLAEEALWKSEEKYRTLIENMGEGVGFLNDEETFMFANESAEKIFGVDKGGLTGLCLSDFLLGENIEIVKSETSKRSQGKGSTYELEIFLKDGSKKDILVTATPNFEDQKFLGTFGIFRDISDRKKTEETITMLAHATRSISECISITDMNDKIVFVNRAFLKTYQYQEHELVGNSIRMVRSPNNIPSVVQQILPATLLGGWQGELLNLRKDGSEFPIHISSSVIRDENGKPIALVGVANDITERRQAEEKLRRMNEELNTAIAEKDKFFSVIAHDLRTPFNVLLGYTEMMVEELDTLTLNDIQDIAVTMRKSAMNLFTLLEDLLEWSLVQRGMISFEPASIPLMQKISESVDVLAESAQKKEIDISLNIPGDLKVFADKDMLGGIVRNLFTNAIKFTPKGGKITIVAKPAFCRLIEISIGDTGIGMNQRIIDHLFHLDEQTNRKGTDGEPSSGLGLIICKDFIEKHGGRLWAESEEGKGSTFYFTLPDVAPV